MYVPIYVHTILRIETEDQFFEKIFTFLRTHIHHPKPIHEKKFSNPSL